MKPCNGHGGRVGSALLLTAAIVCAGRPAAAQPGRYVLDVRLDPERGRLGDDAFLRACRRFYEKIEGRSVGTSEFRAHWREALGDEELLSAWLDSPGSAPVPPAE
jgi:hypothetical protein